MGTPKSDAVKDTKRVKGKEYSVLIGFNLANGDRYEVGQTAKDLNPHEVKVLTELKAIEAK